jgi:hypothetical protein
MKNPRAVAARGLRIIVAGRSYATPARAAQRPLARRPPNRLFRDDLIAASGLDSLSVGVAGGADRRLLDLIEEVGRHGIK